MNALAPHPARRPHHLPLLRRRLRRAGGARRPRRRGHRRRSRCIRRISAGSARRARRSARRWRSTTGCCIRCCGRRTARLRASTGTTRSTGSPTASARIVERDGPDAVAFYLSGQLLTEDYYVANKLMKGFIGSANVDTNSRLCMASSVAGHRRAFGADTVPGSYEDLDEADLIVLVGSNAAWCHPVLFQRMIAQPARARRQDRRHRSAPHRDRRGRRPVPADRARHGHRAVLRPAGPSRRHRRARLRLYRRAHDAASTRRSRARARSRPTSRRPPPRPASTQADVARFFDLFRATTRTSSPASRKA